MRRAMIMLALGCLLTGLAGCGGSFQAVADEEAVKLGHRVTKDLNGYVVAGKIGGQPVSMARVEQWLRKPPAAYYRGRETQTHEVVQAEGEGRFVVVAFSYESVRGFNKEEALGRACLRLTVVLKPGVPGVRDDVIDCPENAPVRRS